jgi:Flp pilus assembly protein TadD
MPTASSSVTTGDRVARRGVESWAGAPEVQTSLGLNLLGSKQTELGVAKLQDVLRKDPAQARASTALALHALREQQPRRAVELMEVVIRREPDNLPALNVLGVARAAAGDLAGARKAYEKALAKDKTFDSVKLNLARSWMLPKASRIRHAAARCTAQGKSGSFFSAV